MEHTTILNLNKDFKRLYYRGKTSISPALVIYAIKNKTPGQNRYGITVTKKIGTAVCRNRCKRVIREAYRMLEHQLPTGWDFVFVARSKTATVKSTQLAQTMKKQVETITKAPQKQKKKEMGQKQ